MAEYKIAITNRIASIEGGVELVCNNPTDSIRFEFDEEWSGVEAKTARFSWEGKHIDVPFVGNVVQIPEIFQTNYVHIGVYAENITSTPIKVKCRFSIKCLGGKVEAPTEDVYNEIIALINANLRSYDAQPFETSGNIVQLDNYNGMPMNCQTHIDLVQEGSGDPAPDNIRAITGFDSATLTRCGKNLVKPTLNSGSIFGATITNSGDGYYTINGTPTQNGVFIISEMTLPAGTYTISYVVDSGSYSGNEANRYVAQLVDVGTGKMLSAAYTDSPYDTYTLTETKKVCIRLYGAINKTYNQFKIAIQLESGAVATDYEPWQGNAFAVDFGQTVYGGVMDWNTGVLTIGSKCITLDGNPNIVWRITTSGKAAYTEGYISGAKIVGTYDLVGICSHVPVSKTTGALYRGAIMCAYAGGKGLQMALDYFPISSLTVADFNAFLAAQHAAGTPVQICYELAEPITIQLTPAQITAIQGTNYIWSDVGETTVSGRKDILWLTDYLIERIKTLETAIISTGGNV